MDAKHPTQPHENAETKTKSCKCGCGQEVSKSANYVRGHNHRGSKHSEAWIAKQSVGVRLAHTRGVFVDGCRKRKEKTLASRPLCACGCGHRVAKAKSKYYKDHFMPPSCVNEVMTTLRQKRDMEKIKVENSKLLTTRIQEWKDSGQYEDIRRTAGLAKDMPNHIAAKQWVIRDPNGKTHEISNMASWARANAHLFNDHAPSSKQPHWLRISSGIRELLLKDGRSNTYYGWVAVGKEEIEENRQDDKP